MIRHDTMQVARKAKPADQRLTDFIKSQGGLHAVSPGKIDADARTEKFGYERRLEHLNAIWPAPGLDDTRLS